MNSRGISIIALLVLLSASTLTGSDAEGNDWDNESVIHSPTRSYFSGGNGTTDDPYQISNVSELQNISLNLTEHFVLLNDIDAKETRTWNGEMGFQSIGSGDFPFNGSLNGAGFKIRNLWINRSGFGYIGLFSAISSAKIHHLDVHASLVKGETTTGIICGITQDSEIENCTVTGKLEGQSTYIGGLTGHCSGDITRIMNCSSEVDIKISGTGDLGSIGGLVGYLRSGLVDNCKSEGDLTLAGSGISYVGTIGGLIGVNTGLAQYSHSSGSIEIKGWRTAEIIGGLIGWNEGTVDNCYSESEIEIVGSSSSSCNLVGGLIGRNVGTITQSSWVGFINIYSSTGVITLSYTGGLTGSNAGSISSCHSAGLLLLSGNAFYIGGLSGHSSGPVTGSYSTASIDISAQSYSSYVAGLIGIFNSVELSNCYSTGSVDVNVSDGDCDYLGGLVGQFYRGQVTNCYSSSIVSVTAPGYIHRTGGLIGYCNDVIVDRTHSTGSIKVYISGGYSQFIGGLIGQNDYGTVTNSYSIGSIKINGSGNVYNVGGLIGWNNIAVEYIYSTVSIDISVSPISTVGVHSIGGLIGYTSQNAQWCYSEGDIIFDLSGSLGNNKFYSIGGLIGENTGGFISRAYSKSNILKKAVTGNGDQYTPQRVGGLIGSNNGDVRYCYSMGTISINESINGEDIGGLVGYNDNSISDCYADGSFFYTQAQNINDIGGLVGVNYGEGEASLTNSYSVFSLTGAGTIEVGGLVGNNLGSMTGCFYDGEVFPYNKSVVRGSSLGSSKNTTTEMNKMETFLNEDWDFVNSWGIIEDRTYPWLYQLYSAPIIKMEKFDVALEDEEYVVEYELTYSEYPSINYLEEPEYETSASWIDLDRQKNQLFGTPGNDDVGFYWLTLSVKDYVGEATNVSFDFEVRNVNDPPQIITEDITSVKEDEPYSRYYYAIDIDPLLTEISWTMQTNARWLEFDGNHIHGMPLNYDIGEYWVNVSVYDTEGGLGFSNFTLTVESANDAPVITMVPVTLAIEDNPYVLNLKAEDEDLNDMLTWTLESAPSWILFTRTQIKGTPTNDDIGTSWVRLKVTDLEGASDEISFLLEVKNVNDQPTWVEFPEDINITEGDLVTLNVLAEDIDLGDVISYNITSDPPSNITIHSRTGAIKWTDTSTGNYTINVSASDGKDRIHHQFIIIVNKVPPVVEPENHLPKIDFVENLKIEVGKTLSFQINATDEDGDALFYEIFEGPEMMIISGSGRLVWTPSDDDIGNHTVNVSVSDSEGYTFLEFNVEITPRPPVDDDDDNEISENESTAPYISAIIIMALIIGAMILLVLLLMRKRSTNDKVPKVFVGADTKENIEEEE